VLACDLYFYASREPNRRSNRNEGNAVWVDPEKETAMSDTPPLPGDETEPGTKQSAPDVCPDCGGSGRKDGTDCPTCAGTGTITVIVGDA
jgi:hypothetical protein